VYQSLRGEEGKGGFLSGVQEATLWAFLHCVGRGKKEGGESYRSTPQKEFCANLKRTKKKKPQNKRKKKRKGGGSRVWDKRNAYNYARGKKKYMHGQKRGVGGHDGKT